MELVAKQFAESNDFNHNMLKAAEEATELSEVCLKMVNKGPDFKPDPKEILEEYADVVYRGLIAVFTVFPDEDIDDLLGQVCDRMEHKLTQMIERKETSSTPNKM